MPATDPALVEMTSEIAGAYMAHNSVLPADVPALLSAVYDALAGLGAPAPVPAEPGKPVPRVPIRKTVTDDHIVSLEDGRPYKALKRHLAGLGMTPEQYRAKWGLPADYPMVSTSYSAARSALAKDLGFGLQRRKR